MFPVKRSVFVAIILSLFASHSLAACRQALALGLDVSGSVDAREYRLQLNGLAAALDSPEVRGAIFSMPDAPIALMVYEWSGVKDTAVILKWMDLNDEDTLDLAVQTLRDTQRREATPGTALGISMQSGVAFLAQKPDCWKHTLDISGDGKSNLGPRPRDVQPSLPVQGITINALVIGADAASIGDLRQTQVGELVAYFQANVIQGPDAFVEAALGYDDYAAAMARKLLREIETINLSQLTPKTSNWLR
ncbi:MAG: DUF1194 domain-containing protein [Paracoccaceae bacterium]